VTFPLEQVSAAIQDRASVWTGLGLRQRVRSVHPNHGKAVTAVEFESAVWLVEVSVWNSGEADLSTVRLVDDRVVNEMYGLIGLEDLNGLLDELVRLLVHDELPRAAVVYQWPGTAPR
jgi:hypothetical protein